MVVIVIILVSDHDHDHYHDGGDIILMNNKMQDSRKVWEIEFKTKHIWSGLFLESNTEKMQELIFSWMFDCNTDLKAD